MSDYNPELGNTNDLLRQPEIVSRRTVYRGKRIDLELLTVRSPDGRETLREVVRHPGAVVILPITDDGQVVFVRNVRVAIGQVLLELPAGTLDKGEPPAACAARELAEETGFSASRIEPLIHFYTSPGVLSEPIWAFVATGLTAGEMELDPGEQLVTELMPYDAAVRMCVDGSIHDAKTLAALLTHHLRSKGGQGR
ncbi:MAG: NUDIX hydrolase [Phycisphaerae bacterium]|nr:NUDIX hydrolase [Phycisphaerae bacterium]